MMSIRCRAAALLRARDRKDHRGIDLDYATPADRSKPTPAALLETAVHEICHATVIGREALQAKDITDLVTTSIGYMVHDAADGKDTRGSIWQEILTLAAEVVVLRRLGIKGMGWKAVRDSAARGVELFTPKVFDRLVARSIRSRVTQRRATQALAILDEICEAGS